MLLTELLSLYVSKRLKGKSPNTVRLYRHAIRSFAITLSRQPTMADLTDEEVERHMWRIVQSGGSPASANKDHGQLTALWRFASHNRMLDTWPNVRTMQEVERVPMGWLPGEVHRLFAAIKLEPGTIGTVKANLWWEALILVLLDTGERIGAIRGLLHEHVQGDWLLVPARLRKGNRRDRLYKLNDETAEILKILIESNLESDTLFHWDRCETYIYNRYKAILRRAKLPDDSRSQFHRLRRTVASAVASVGGDASAALDHASPRTTKKYLDPRIVGNVQPSDILANWLRNPPKQDKKKLG